MVFWLLILIVASGFGGVLLFGAPYLPTRSKQAEQALTLLELKPGQVFYDLGCGDGRLLRAAARSGAVAVGYELNPILFLICYFSCLPYGGKIKVRLGSFWRAKISDADAIFVFLLDKYMFRFDKFMQNQSFTKSVKLVSYTFKIPGKKAVKRSGPLFLYQY